MHETNVPLCLNHARDEVLMSLGALNAEESARHRKLANDYIREAVQGMRREPGREYNWSLLNTHH
jgi:hypothetical protein